MEQQNIRIREEFIKNIDGKDFVLYSGLLDLAHQLGLVSIQVEILQFPTDENRFTAICKASALQKGGNVFIDVGDANPTNCNRKVAAHAIRMASTRAKARALRDLTNIGMTCLEELGENEESPESRFAQRSQEQSIPRQSVQKETSSDDKPKSGFINPMSEAQKRAIQNLAKRKGMAGDALDQEIRVILASSIASFETLNIQQASVVIKHFQSEDNRAAA